MIISSHPNWTIPSGLVKFVNEYIKLFPGMCLPLASSNNPQLGESESRRSYKNGISRTSFRCQNCTWHYEAYSIKEK